VALPFNICVRKGVGVPAIKSGVLLGRNKTGGESKIASAHHG
jgi:hypothetical protein